MEFVNGDTTGRKRGQGMSKKLKPFLAHSELTDCIYVIDGNDKYEVTEQCIKAMKATNRMANVLDKIRAEIMDFEEELFHRPNTDYSDYAAVRHCVEIIDKYTAESEE